MPNWIEGTLKLRGTIENLRRFFSEALVVPKTYRSVRTVCRDATERLEMEPSETYNSGEVKFTYQDSAVSIAIPYTMYIHGTRRAYIDKVRDTFWIHSPEKPEVIWVPVRQAWEFTPESWTEISAKYNIDVRLHGFECGMEFSQELEVIAGKVTFFKETTYSDYRWECPFPNLGG